MTGFLVKIFIKDSERTKDPIVRQQYGKLSGIVGIVSNAILCIMKIVTGLITGSIAILADGINNLSDASSSVITLVSFWIAGKPSDEEHPFGHARVEYIAGLIVSMLIIVLGIQFLLTSIGKIRNPEPIEFRPTVIVILMLAIAIKCWQAYFNFKIGKKINSTTIKATGADSRNDVIATTAVLIGVVVARITGIQLDGIMGALVALFIFYSGVQLIRETSQPLLGQPPEPELVEEIHRRILEKEDVIGIHDLVIHNYGPGRIFASVHIEVDAKGDVIKNHDTIDNIEREMKRELNIDLVAHMDPLDIDDPLISDLNVKINLILKKIHTDLSFHDLRVVNGYTHKNIIFDIVVPFGFPMKDKELIQEVSEKIRGIEASYSSVITIDQKYS